MFSRRDLLQLVPVAPLALSLPLASCTGQDAITFANPAPVWWNAVPLIAQRHNLYSKFGANVAGFDVPTGVRSKQAIVDGNAQMGVAAQNAISTSSDEELGKLHILASITQSNSTIAIVSRKPIAQLATTKIGYVRGSISEFYLVSHLLRTGQGQLHQGKQLELVDLAPPNLLPAFQDGQIDAAVAWEPFASQIEMAARKKGPVHILRDPGLYNQHIFALASRSANADSRARVLQGLKAAAELIEANRARIADELETFFKFPKSFLSGSDVWEKTRFNYSVDKAAIAQALNTDLDLAKRVGVARTGGGAVFSELLSQLS